MQRRNEQIRGESQRAPDRHALEQAAGQLVRVAIAECSRQADLGDGGLGEGELV